MRIEKNKGVRVMNSKNNLLYYLVDWSGVPSYVQGLAGDFSQVRDINPNCDLHVGCREDEEGWFILQVPCPTGSSYRILWSQKDELISKSGHRTLNLHVMDKAKRSITALLECNEKLKLFVQDDDKERIEEFSAILRGAQGTWENLEDSFRSHLEDTARFVGTSMGDKMRYEGSGGGGDYLLRLVGEIFLAICEDAELCKEGFLDILGSVSPEKETPSIFSPLVRLLYLLTSWNGNLEKEEEDLPSAGDVVSDIDLSRIRRQNRIIRNIFLASDDGVDLDESRPTLKEVPPTL